MKNGEFPKFFPFTRFTIKSVMGEFENGDLNDIKGRLVNKKGYLIDKNGNVVNG